MTRTSFFAAITASVAVALAPATAPGQARGQDAAVLFQAAVHQETVIGNLDSAITLYRRIAADRRAERGTTARALVNLGRAYEMRGHSEALRTYQRVVSEFGDQSEQVTAARERLAVLQAGSPASNAGRVGASFVQTMIFPDLPTLRSGDAPNYDVAPTGDRLVLRANAPDDSTMGSAMTIANNSGAVLRTLLPPVREVSRRSMRWSPDGKFILYREAAWVGADTTFGGIKVISPEGGPSRVVVPKYYENSSARGGLFWTPDSKAFTVVDQNQLITMDLEGKVVRTVPFVVHQWTQFTGYSPDGRWLAFHKQTEGSEQAQFDVWVMPAVGGTPVQVTHSGYVDTWPAWAPDGRSLYFASSRGGNSNIWQVHIDPRTGAPVGEPLPLTSYSDVSVRLLKVLPDGKVVFALVQQLKTIRVASTANPQAQRSIARGSDPWVSPDGRTVYYLAQGVTPPGVFAVSTDSMATPRRLTTSGPGDLAFQSFSVASDGRELAYFAHERMQSVLRTVPTGGGATREILRLDSRRHVFPAWSPDGSRIAYTHDSILYSIPSQGGAPRALAKLHKWEGWTVRWSPDGQFVAAFAYPTRADTQNAMFIIPANGGEPRRLTPKEETGYKELLDWHPDGRRLTYMYYGHDDKADETRWAFVDGRPTTKLLDQPYPTWDYVGKWHPGGRDYYFIASTQAWSLYAHNSSTGESKLVWHHGGSSPGANFVPSFSRDGSVMAWETGTTSRQLWVMERARP